MKDQYTTPPPKPKPQRPPTQAGRTTKKSLDAFRTLAKLQRSRLEAAVGDNDRVELVRLMDAIDKMVPKGYTESSWSESAQNKVDLWTEDEEGEPDARVRYEDLRDDPYFEEYESLLRRLDDAMESFGLARPETPARSTTSL